MSCHKCDNLITDERIRVQCTECFADFHVGCTRIKNQENLSRLGSKRATWQCSECKSATSREIKSLMSKLEGIDETATKINERGEKLETSITDIRNNLVTAFDRISELEAENKNLKETLSTITESLHHVSVRLDAVEQKTRSNNVEVVGVPKLPGENCYKIVKKIGELCGLNVDNDDIQICHRIKPKNTDREPSIVVQLASVLLKKKWIKAAKQAKVKASQINQTFPKDNVFVFEHLAPTNKDLFYDVRQFKKRSNIPFAWTNDGKVLVKLEESGPTIRIHNKEDLAKIETQYAEKTKVANSSQGDSSTADN